MNIKNQKAQKSALKTAPKRAIQKTAEVTDDLIGKKLLINIPESQKVHQRIIQ